MSFIRRALYLLGPYTDADEKSVGNFFKKLNEQDSPIESRTGLDKLLQSNIAVINLWTEYRYKGYKYLRKSQRKELYANLQRITEDFERFYRSNARSAEAVLSHIQTLKPHAAIQAEKIIYLQALMDYFLPRRGVYEYRDSSSFGRLLQDPTHKKLIGDCNQIVTLYIYLYSRRYDIHDLQVRVLPEHVALNYGGIDIETTTGLFADYDHREGTALLPIEEIVSINLLDTTDSYFSTHEVAAEDLLQASRLAFILSHNRDIATRNLEIAYKKLIANLLERNNYAKALKYAIDSGDTALIGNVGHNGAVYEIEHGNYASARRFAQYAPARDRLVLNSWQEEGLRHYEEHRYHDAIKAFQHTDNQNLVHQSYRALFYQEQGKLGSGLTTSTVKEHAGTIKRMQSYARKSNDKQLIEYADSLNKHL